MIHDDTCYMGQIFYITSILNAHIWLEQPPARIACPKYTVLGNLRSWIWIALLPWACSSSSREILYPRGWNIPSLQRGIPEGVHSLDPVVHDDWWGNGSYWNIGGCSWSTMLGTQFLLYQYFACTSIIVYMFQLCFCVLQSICSLFFLQRWTNNQPFETLVLGSCAPIIGKGFNSWNCLRCFYHTEC